MYLYICARHSVLSYMEGICHPFWTFVSILYLVNFNSNGPLPPTIEIQTSFLFAVSSECRNLAFDLGWLYQSEASDERKRHRTNLFCLHGSRHSCESGSRGFSGDTQHPVLVVVLLSLLDGSRHSDFTLKGQHDVVGKSVRLWTQMAACD